MRIGNLLALSLIAFMLGLNQQVYAGANDGRRQNVEQRTLGYATGVDLVELRNDAMKNWRATGTKAQTKTFSDGSDSGSTEDDGCGGYTVSECGITCCGQAECESACEASITSAHGNDFTCLDPIQTSSCGKSCCGARDCEKVCLHYNFDMCDGQTQTTGEWNSAAKGLPCCGRDNCHAVECGFFTKTKGDSGGHKGLSCCGMDDCKDKECDGYTKVDSLIYPDLKDLYCCGQEECHRVECDNYVITDTPHGQEECCGYDDCHYKECEGVFSVKVGGQDVPCCGIEHCAEIASCIAPDHIAECVMRFVDSSNGATTGLRSETWGEGTLWIGIVGDDYWAGECSVYEHFARVEMIHPEYLLSATLEYAKWDDYIQIYLGGELPNKNSLRKVFNGPARGNTSSKDGVTYDGPTGKFPPETDGECELAVSWDPSLHIDVTSFFRDKSPGDIVSFLTRVSVTGRGEGYARIRFHYDMSQFQSKLPVYDGPYFTNEGLYDTEYTDEASKYGRGP